MKTLLIGDMHVQPSNLKESKEIFEFILKTVKKNKIKHIVFLGDLNHTHGVVRVECLYFWNECFSSVPEDINIDIIIGNHDKILGQSEHAGKHSLNEFVGKFANIQIIDSIHISDGIGFIPYIHNELEFIDAINSIPEDIDTVICHQTFNGANYENGFYAKDGFDLSKIKPEIKHIISGHIHSEQEFDRVWYPGNPRWLTNAEANQEKNIWIIDLNKPTDRKAISMAGIAIGIHKFTIKEGDSLPDFKLTDRNFVELVGSSTWCSDIKKKIKAGISIKTCYTDKKVSHFDTNSLPSIHDYLHNNFNLSGITDIIKIGEYKSKIKEYLNGII